MNMMSPRRQRLVLVGNGMAGVRALEEILARAPHDYQITVFGAEPHGNYSGETRFPLIFQNIHRWFWYAALLVSAVLTYDAVLTFRDTHDHWGHAGLGTVIFVVNIVLIWLYTLSCHSCRHLIGGRLRHFSKHPTRYWLWTHVSKLNTRHMQLAWTTLATLFVTDAYIALVSSGAIGDLRFVN